MRRLRVLALVAPMAAALVVAASGGAKPEPDAAWTSFGHDSQIDAFTAAPSFTTKAKGFSLVWKAALAGGITASPLAATVTNRGLVVFASTDQGNVYAVGTGGKVLWERSLGTVVSDRGCGTYGIDSTGFVDTQRDVLYVIGATGMLHALRLADGTDAAGFPIPIVTRTHTEFVWGGLRLQGHRLYVPVASYCDEPNNRGVPANGRLIAVDVDAPAAAPTVFQTEPMPNNVAGVWGWGGVSISATGDALYFGVGNAEPDVESGFSDSMVELTSDLSEVVGWDRPSTAIPEGDTDIGAAPVLFQPTGCPALLAANAKSGHLLVWRQNALATTPPLEIPLSDGESSFEGAPSWSPRTQMLYDAGATENSKGNRLVGTIALQATKTCGFAQRWFHATGSGSMPEPLVAGDLVASTGGFAGGFQVSRAKTGIVVWRFGTTSPTLGPLIEARGELIGGDEAGNLYAFRPR